MDNLSRNPFNPLLKHSQNLLLQLGFHNFLISTSFLLQSSVFHNFIVPHFNFSHWIFCLLLSRLSFSQAPFCMRIVEIGKYNFSKTSSFCFSPFCFVGFFFAGSFMHCGMQTMKTQLSIFSDFFLSSFPLSRRSFYFCLSALSFSAGWNAKVGNSNFP